MQSLRNLCGLLLGLGLVTPAYTAEPAGSGDWREFRNGGSSHTTALPPQEWTPETGIRWQTETAGYGQSAPIIQGERIFLTAVLGPMKEQGRMACYDLRTGQELWADELPTAFQRASNYTASRAAPTPLTDGKQVYAFYESGNVLAWSLEGKRLWERNLVADYGDFQNGHGLGTSPAQTETHVIINVEHQGPSYLLALDKQTGETAWKAERPSSSSWTSPIVIETENGPQVVVSSSGRVTGYAAKTGQLMWDIEGLAGNSVPSPSFADGKLLIGARLPEFGSAKQATESNLCLVPNASQPGTFQVAWRSQKAVSDYASPILAAGHVYFLSKVGVLYCLDANTGSPVYTQRLGVECWATPVLAGDLLYYFGKDGKTVVIQTGPEFREVAVNHLWDPENAPAPEEYTEYTPPRAREEDSSEEQGPRLGRMARMLLRGDANEDGLLQKSELPEQFQASFEEYDKNSDGALDHEELAEMEKQFRANREGSRESARDPIVYGVAAAQDVWIVRTGTRLYCLDGVSAGGAK